MTAPRIQLTVDLRSDVLSRPTPAMWEAMASTDIGLYDFDDDSTVHTLEARVAEIAGKEAGFYAVTGRVANITALMSLAGGDRPLVRESRSHLAVNERAGITAIARIPAYDLLGDSLGEMDAGELAEVVREAGRRHRTGPVVALENTHSAAGGCALTVAATTELSAAAREAGATYVYVDGARLWNAAVALRTPIQDLLAPIDAAMLSLSKGLGGPFGAVVVGSAVVIKAVRQQAHLLGALSVHRMGYLAAAGLVALDTRAGKLEEDHRRARLLANGLASIEGLRVDFRSVQTNLVRVEVTAPSLNASSFVQGLSGYGIGATVIEPPGAVRLAVYHQITDDDINSAIRAAELVAAEATSTNFANRS
jgi:threonine aldolase